MNVEKAREYFSAYNEGTLDRGLKETFERSLRTDAQVQAEYRAFERLMAELDALKAPAPEPEVDLHEAIARRLDKHIFEQKRRASVPLLGWWKSLALGGLATVALGAAILNLRSNGASGPQTSGIFTLPAEKLMLQSDSKGYRLVYATSGEKSVFIRSLDGAVLVHRTVTNGTISSPLSNPNPTAALLKVEVVGEKLETYVALPGTKMESAATGEGSVQDLALAVAGYYRAPVMFTLGSAAKVKWELKPGEGIDAVEKALSGTSYNAQKNVDGVFTIQPN